MNGRTMFVALRLKTLAGVLILACIVAIGAYIKTQLRTVTVSITDHVAGRTVLIDAGHGGRDPGAVGVGGLLEKEVTLGVALHLERLLQRAAVHVVMTRRDDRDLADPGASSRKVQDLSRRVARGQQAGADVFVSIHGNSFPSPAWSGAQTFYFPDRSDDRWLAERVQERLRLQLGPNRREAAAADYFVLRESTMPAVVVEVGFLSHPRESELLGTATYQRRVAEAIYMGIIDYFAQPRPVGTDGFLDSQTTTGLIPTESAVRDDEVLLYFVSPSEEAPTATVRRFGAFWHALELQEQIELTINTLLAGPKDEPDLVAVIPPEVTLRSLRIDGSTIYLDFTEQLRDHFVGGAREEQLIIDSLLLTLTQFAQLKHLHILIEGEETTSIGGHIHLGAPLEIPASHRP